MKKRRLIVIVAAVIFVLGVCLLPLPMKRNLEVKGYERSKDGATLEEVTIEVDCWEWNFLFLQDKLTGTVKVNYQRGSISMKLNNGDKMPGGTFQASGRGYQNDQGSEDGKYLYGASMMCNEDVTMIAVRTFTEEQERYFVGAKDSTITAENIWSYFYGNP